MQNHSRPKISVFVITRNEAEKIGECLDSLAWLEEVVVVDDDSDDGTREICRSKAVQLYQHPFTGFRDQKSYAMSLCSNNWVLEMDADERVSVEMRASIEGLSRSEWETTACFFFPRLTYFWGRWIRRASLYPDYKGRLYNRKRGKWSEANIHERFVPDGPSKKLSGDIIHFQDLDLSTYLTRTVRYSRLSAAEYLARGKKAGFPDVVFRPLYTFFYRYVLRLGFLEGVHGFVIAAVGAVGTFAKYGVLLELTRRYRNGDR